MSGNKPDGIDVAIAAYFGARLSGLSTDEAARDAKFILELFGIKPDATPETDHAKGDGDG